MVKIKPKVQIREKVPETKKSKLLLPIIAIGLIALLVGGYFVLNSGNKEPVVDTENTAQTDKVDVTSTAKPIPTAAGEQSTKAKGTNIATSPDQTSVQSGKDQPVKTVKPEGIKPENELPYKKGEAYKVYQFPFGTAHYSQPNTELDKLVEVMKQNLTMKISIWAYTDSVGDAKFNQWLSGQRAKTIRDYLISKGIEQNRLTSEGKGISTKYATAAENRRAEFILS